MCSRSGGAFRAVCCRVRCGFLFLVEEDAAKGDMPRWWSRWRLANRMRWTTGNQENAASIQALEDRGALLSLGRPFGGDSSEQTLLNAARSLTNSSAISARRGWSGSGLWMRSRSPSRTWTILTAGFHLSCAIICNTGGKQERGRRRRRRRRREDPGERAKPPSA